MMESIYIYCYEIRCIKVGDTEIAPHLNDGVNQQLKLEKPLSHPTGSVIDGRKAELLVGNSKTLQHN